MKKQEAIKKLIALKNFGIYLLDRSVVNKEKMWKSVQEALNMAIEALEKKDLPNTDSSAQPKPLTDKEKRIFLAAMEREKEICKAIDAEDIIEPYEDSLLSICYAIEQKVKGALWKGQK